MFCADEGCQKKTARIQRYRKQCARFDSKEDRSFREESTLTGKDVGVSVLLFVFVLIGLLVCPLSITSWQGLRDKIAVFMKPHMLKNGSLAVHGQCVVFCRMLALPLLYTVHSCPLKNFNFLNCTDKPSK